MSNKSNSATVITLFSDRLFSYSTHMSVSEGKFVWGSITKEASHTDAFSHLKISEWYWTRTLKCDKYCNSPNNIDSNYCTFSSRRVMRIKNITHWGYLYLSQWTIKLPELILKAHCFNQQRKWNLDQARNKLLQLQHVQGRGAISWPRTQV